ncbi:MAG: alpha/beta hydrolase [Microbacterium sp.]|nr:alpha/beta hydrolase [Microbacterium sp.]
MSIFVLIHGASDVGWSWHLVVEELERRGHQAIAPDLPGDDDALTFEDYADAVVGEVASRVGEGRGGEVTVVGHSMGAFTAPLVAERLGAGVLVLLAGMIPAPGESPAQWWESTGCEAAVAAQAAADGGLTGNSDPFVSFYHDVPRALAEQALSKERAHPSSAAWSEPWPLAAWPSASTRVIVCTQDRFFPAEFLRALALSRLGVIADDIDGSHCAPLSRPVEIAALLEQYADEAAAERRGAG